MVVPLPSFKSTDWYPWASQTHDYTVGANAPTRVTVDGSYVSTYAVTSGGGGGGTTTAKGALGTFYVVASDASTADKARADYQCDGTGDQAEIQNAINALKAAKGGRVLLSPGTFAISAGVTISGTDNPDTSATIIVQGMGENNTTLNCAGNVTAFTMSLTARVQIMDMTFNITGTGRAIAATAVGSTLHRSLDESVLRNLHINGGYSAHTGWAMHLGSPFRSLIENLHIEGCKNGIRIFSEDPAQNPGDCTFQRMMVGLYNPAGQTAGTAYSIESPTGAGQMNQIEFIMCEAFMDSANAASGGTGIYLGGGNGVLHCKFHGTNLEQFDTLWWVDYGISNHFDANFITGLDGKTGNVAVKFGPNSTNNWVKNIGSFYAPLAATLISSTATSTANPNLVEHVRITTDTGTNVTNTISTAGAVIRKWIVADGTGAAGVLVTPA